MTTSLPPTARPPPLAAAPSPPAGTPLVTRNRLVKQGASAHQGPSPSAFCLSQRRHGIA